MADSPTLRGELDDVNCSCHCCNSIHFADDAIDGTSDNLLQQIMFRVKTKCRFLIFRCTPCFTRRTDGRGEELPIKRYKTERSDGVCNSL